MTAVDYSAALSTVARDELARRRLLDFAQLVSAKFKTPAHIRYLADLLERVERQEIGNLAISAPPGHGKSTILQAFVAWFIGREPRRRVLTISASELLAKRNSRDTQMLVRSDNWPWPDAGFNNDSMLEWQLTNLSEVRALGGSATTSGYRCELLVLDDLQPDAGSEATRESDFARFQSVVDTRLEPGASIVIIQTRWHDADIIGQISESPDAKHWHFVNLPALAEENDPLGRPVYNPENPDPQSALWPARWPIEFLERKREASPTVFASLYQGDPVPAGGATFKLEWMQNRYDEAPGRYSGFRVLAIDGAWSSKSSADFSALACWASDERRYYLIGAGARRVEFPDLIPWVVQCYRMWKPHVVVAEAAASGIPLVQMLARESSIPIVGIPPRGDKMARVQAVTPLFETGKVWLPKSTSNEWIEQHCRFPTARHDDLVDTTSLALAYLQERDMEAEVERERTARWSRFSTSR